MNLANGSEGVLTLQREETKERLRYYLQGPTNVGSEQGDPTRPQERHLDRGPEGVRGSNYRAKNKKRFKYNLTARVYFFFNSSGDDRQGPGSFGKKRKKGLPWKE